MESKQQPHDVSATTAAEVDVKRRQIIHSAGIAAGAGMLPTRMFATICGGGTVMTLASFIGLMPLAASQ